LKPGDVLPWLKARVLTVIGFYCCQGNGIVQGILIPLGEAYGDRFELQSAFFLTAID
jgi:hypothetical protein